MTKTVRLSGSVAGTEDINRHIRAQMLYTLFASGWDIHNTNGTRNVSLQNIENEIIKADAFLFMPGASLQDIFQAISVFVGYQTLDKHLHNKPTVILNTDHSWDGFFSLLNDLQELGTIKQNYRDFILETNVPNIALNTIHNGHDVTTIVNTENTFTLKKAVDGLESTRPDNLQLNVCVFCSASIEAQGYLDEGYRLGKLLAENNMGCVSGAGKSGVMGAVVKGCIEANGWAAGSNIPHIINIEGLPEGLSEFWLREDIYTRMEVMIENSNAFVIFPGGSGTVQELLALLLLQQENHPLMQNKTIILYNKRVDQKDRGFWDNLIELLPGLTTPEAYHIVDSITDVLTLLKRHSKQQR